MWLQNLQNESESNTKHQKDVTVNIHKTLPEELRDRMVPSWFDHNLFPSHSNKLSLTEDKWKDRLSRTEFRILISEGTELPYANEYHSTDTEGLYVCRGCSNPMFSSAAKFRSSSGWPSFFAPISTDRIGVRSDKNLLMERTEVHCSRCGGHLGHVFDDGPEPTGLRYCLNSPALRLIDKETHQKIANGKEEELEFTLNR